MEQFTHSVMLDKELCMGCINCIKRCPTEAIRVRDGKAHILKERCIDCGECIRICPHHAKKAITDPISILENFQYTIALPPPSLYGQYNNLEEQDLLLEALLGMGFDSVFEVAKAAELVSDATRRLLQTGSMKRPVISSACPAVTRLIRVRFPELIDHVLPLVAPIELAARMAKKDAVRKTGLPKEAIGCIFLTPCPAKVTATRSPVGSAHSEVDGAVAIKDIYPRLLASMKRIQQVDYLASAGRIGLGWAESGGEAAGLVSTDSYLAADGIENVIRVLEDLEDEKYQNLDFVELNACAGGCVGGVLQITYSTEDLMKEMWPKERIEDPVSVVAWRPYGFALQEDGSFFLPVGVAQYDEKGCRSVPMLGRYRGNLAEMTLDFENMFSAVELRLRKDSFALEPIKVKQVILQGNDGEILAGSIKVVASRQELPDSVCEERKVSPCVVLDCGSGVELTEESTSFYLPVLPVEFRRGYSLTVVTDRDSGNMFRIQCGGKFPVPVNPQFPQTSAPQPM